MVFPLPRGRRWSSGWWSRTNRCALWQQRTVSRMKRSVASCLMSRSRVDSKTRNGPQASHRPTEQQALFLVATEGATVSLLALPWCAVRAGSSVKPAACSPSHGEQAPRARCSLATTLSAVTPSSSSRLFCSMRLYALLPVFLFYGPGLSMQGKDADGPSCAAGPVGTQ